MVEIIRKARLPRPEEVPPGLLAAATAASGIKVREPRPAGFALLFTSQMQMLEPAVAFLHEHAIQRAHTPDTVRTYTEILYDWFDALEQSGISWRDADAIDLVAYRNRMLEHSSAHTRRPYSVRTINHRVRGVLRFYAWAVRNGWLHESVLAGRGNDLVLAHHARAAKRYTSELDRCVFLLRQFESLPRPLTSAQARELLAELTTPYDLIARWQLYTGLRVSEALHLTLQDVFKPVAPQATYRVIDVMRKGRKAGHVIAPISLLEETAAYRDRHRNVWQKRAIRKGRKPTRSALFLNRRGSSVKKRQYQRVIQRTGQACGFKATSHLLRATFGCMMLARLERLARDGAAINPLLIVKILMGHEHIATTDRYLRAVAVDTHALSEVLDSLVSSRQ
jgi:site-specific recombinase XerD